MSLTLTTNGIVTTHTHQWIFASGGGNGITCALGQASQVQFTVESSHVAHIIEVLHNGGELDFRDRVLTNLFDRSTTKFVRMLPEFESADRSLTALEIHQWVAEQSKYLNEIAANLRTR